MKRFAKKILLITIFLFVVNLLLFFAVEQLYYSPYLNQPALSSSDNTIVFSDSHGIPLDSVTLARQGVRNYSANSDNYIDIYIKLQDMLLQQKKVRRIILTADDYSLSPYRVKNNNNDISIQKLDFTLYNANVDSMATPVDFFKQKYLRHYFVFVNSRARDIIIQYPPKLIRSLFVNTEPNQDWSLIANKREQAYSRITDQYPNGEKSAILQHALQQIISLCRENKIEIIGVKFPMTLSYLDIADSKSGFAPDSIFEVNGIQILDYRKIYTTNDYFFKDPDHLNRLGGLDFSRKLVADMSTSN